MFRYNDRLSLNWKSHVNYISMKIKRNIGILSKIRHYVSLKTLTNFHYSPIYPFLIYGITARGNTYRSLLFPTTMTTLTLFSRLFK